MEHKDFDSRPMQIAVHRMDEASEYFFKEGCHILEWYNSPADPVVSIARARVEAGMKTRRHFLIDTTERYLIQSGEGIVTIGDRAPECVAEGTVVTIPPGVHQSIHNTGSRDLVFLAICTPRFVPPSYVDAEQKS